jgi:GNAT superfamily N-acetyltransferase
VHSLSSDGGRVVAGPPGGAAGGLVIERLPITAPDALRLVEEVQEEYVLRYGGRDESPIDPREFEDPTGMFFVGRLDAVPVTSGAWRRRTDVSVAGTTLTAEVKRMYVAPRARGRGLARAILAHLEETARAAGAEAMVLETGIRQPEAIALYESSGYLPIDGFGHYKDALLSRCLARSLRLPAAQEKSSS